MTRAWTTGAKVAVAWLVGLVVTVLLFPSGGVDTIPPQCLSVLGYPVPCVGGLAIGAGAATAGLIGMAMWLRSRRR